MESPAAKSKALNIVGYADKFSVRPGEKLDFMISTTSSQYTVNVVRILGGMTDPDNHLFPSEPIAADCAGVYKGRIQEARAGSYAVLPLPEDWLAEGEFGVKLWTFATAPVLGRPQAIWSVHSAGGNRVAAFMLDEEGYLVFALKDASGVQANIRTKAPVMIREWYFVEAKYSVRTATLSLQVSSPGLWKPADHSEASSVHAALDFKDVRIPSVLLAAESEPEFPQGTYHHFNGKIENIVFYRSGPMPIANYDFGADISSSQLTDRSGNGFHGTLYRAPARAVTSHAWTGEYEDFRSAPDHYAAVHFHDDDIEDAGWAVDLTWRLPEDIPSGIYALKLDGDGDTDYIPFYVQPAHSGEKAPVLFLAPTNTYLAYANEQLFMAELGFFKDQELKLASQDLYLSEHTELGKSVYDTHTDGSGVHLTSRLRPILNFRPNYRDWMNGGYARHFAADLYIAGWLEKREHPYDVATDEDLNREGIDLLSPYRVLITGSHPEYWTRPMLQALEKYLNNGGRLMYLGGNGFYWVTSIDPNKPHLVEIRRGNSGTRSWDSPPGEARHSSTGEPGGLWRHHGYVPQRLVGVGFTGQGLGPACGYRRQPDSYLPAYRFIFEGIAEDEEIGNFGFALGGAVGDEFDRLDFNLGTPRHAMWLATSTGLDNEYQFVQEDQLMTLPGQGGSEQPLVRADITYFDIEGGGAVFSVGSINWAASMAWSGYDNNVARISDNILNHYLK